MSLRRIDVNATSFQRNVTVGSLVLFLLNVPTLFFSLFYFLYLHAGQDVLSYCICN